jgi:paraquat-inducible protein B
MAEPTEGSDLPQATVIGPKKGRLSIVWIIPVLAALVAIGIAVQRIRSEGPTIKIVFRAAEGIEAGKTLIKYKDVNIGQVTAVQLTEDFSKVEITAKISKRAQGLMVEDAKFWVVRPSISLSGISGLNTLLSGNYIGFEAGSSENEERNFTGQEVAPFVASQPGRQYILKATDLGSLSVGSPIYYKHLPVGQVIAYGLAEDGKSVEIRVFVNAPYDKFVSPSTRFWNASGVDVTLDANGFDVRTESLVALLVGGLVFDAAPFMPDTTRAPPNTVFTLYNDRATAMKAPDAISRKYVLYFNESLRGLQIGAPVTFLGLPAGEVTAINLTLDPKQATVRPRVTITFYPERLLAYASKAQEDAVVEAMDKDDKQRRIFMERLIQERGLRAQLRTGSLLTGQLYVSFDYYPKAPKVKAINWNSDTPELPVVPGSLTELEAKLTSILDKVDRMPLEAIGNALKKDLEDLDGTLADVRKLLQSADSELVPKLNTDLEGLQRVLTKLERMVDNADATLLSPDAPAQQELRDALTEFTRAARSVRVLIDYLERHPESPIRGKRDTNVSGGK